MAGAKTIADIVQELKENSGVGCYSMRLLRNARGYRKLGVHVAREIEEELARNRVRHQPRKLPHDSQERVVRLWLRDTPVDDLMRAALIPTRPGDARLRRALQALDDEKVLEQVRHLVCPVDTEVE